MELMKVLMHRAKNDNPYGEVIGGVFGGTYPSYEVFNPKFIGKTILQGGLHLLLQTALTASSGPIEWQNLLKQGLKTASMSGKLIKNNSSKQIEWLNGILQKTLVAANEAIDHKNHSKSKNIEIKI